jgi:hypothetical protein
MAPKRSSAAARAKQLQLKGRDLAKKADYLTVCTLLKDRYDLVLEMKQRMVELNMLLPNGEQNPDYHPGDPLPFQDRPASKDVEGSSEGASTQQESQEDLAGIQLHRNFNTWAAIPPKYMKLVLEHLEPVALSRYALKAITSHGAKEPNKDQMLEILEFMTLVPRTQHLGEERSLDALAEFMGRKNEQSNRRCRELTLPVDWQQKGFYSIEQQGDNHGSYRIKDQYASEEVHITLDIADTSFPKVELNFSRASAALVYKNSEDLWEKDNVLQIFIQEGKGKVPAASPQGKTDTPSFKRSRSGIESAGEDMTKIKKMGSPASTKYYKAAPEDSQDLSGTGVEDGLRLAQAVTFGPGPAGARASSDDEAGMGDSEKEDQAKNEMKGHRAGDGDSAEKDDQARLAHIEASFQPNMLVKAEAAG